MDYLLSEEQQMMRDMVAKFAKEEIAPVSRENQEQGVYPQKIVKQAGELGLMGVAYPPEYGGAGMDFVHMNHKKLEGDQINTRSPAETNVYQAPPTSNFCGATTIKEKLPEENIRSRIDADILDAFNRNPYTQSLTSSA